jgi:plasmid stabilization system protein ParE
MLRIILHPEVYSDIDGIMERYERMAIPNLALEFYGELRRFFLEAAKRPETFSTRSGKDIRRVNLERFPYHFLFRVVGDTARILVVRHHRRNPSLGSRRR